MDQLVFEKSDVVFEDVLQVKIRLVNRVLHLFAIALDVACDSLVSLESTFHTRLQPVASQFLKAPTLQLLLVTYTEVQKKGPS